MCGLVGMFGDIHQKERVAFHWLLHLDVVRGFHSTGVAAIHEDGGVNLYKELGQPHNLYAAHPVDWKDGIYQHNNLRCLIGHNRWATQGAIIKENAHPFEFDNCVGAHNGTVQKWFLYKLEGHSKFDVDSKIIYNHISHTKGDIQSVWDVADGAMALTWWDKETKSLKIARNKGRPLFICRLKHKNTLVWASEKWMIEVALDRLKIEHKDIVSIETDVLYHFFIQNNKLEVAKTKLNPFTPPSYTSYYKGGHNVFQSGGSDVGAGKPPVVVLPPQATNTPVWVKVTEYNAPSKLDIDYSGTFFGVLSDGSEVRIPTNGGSQKALYDKLMEACNKKRPYFTFLPSNMYFMYSMNSVHASHLTWKENVIKFPEIDKKIEEADNKKQNQQGGAIVKVDDNWEFMSEGEFYLNTDGVCCCCSSRVKFADIKAKPTNFYFLDRSNVICPACLEEDWVKEQVLQTRVG